MSPYTAGGCIFDFVYVNVNPWSLWSSLLCGRCTVPCAATGSVSWSTWRKRLVCVSSALIPYKEVRPEFSLIPWSGSTTNCSLPHISTHMRAEMSSELVCKSGFSLAVIVDRVTQDSFDGWELFHETIEAIYSLGFGSDRFWIIDRPLRWDLAVVCVQPLEGDITGEDSGFEALWRRFFNIVI